MADEIVDEFAKRHVEQSLAESQDESKVESWTDGARAKEEAHEIATRLLAEAHRKLAERND